MIYLAAFFGFFCILFYEKKFVLLMPVWIALTPKALLFLDVANIPALSLYKLFCALLFLRFIIVVAIKKKGFIWCDVNITRPLVILFFSFLIPVLMNLNSKDAGVFTAIGVFIEVIFPAYIYCYHLRNENHIYLKRLLFQYLSFYLFLAIYGSVCYLIDYNPYIEFIQSTTYTGRVVVQTYAETLRGARAQATISHPITYGAFLSLSLILLFLLKRDLLNKNDIGKVLFFVVVILYAVFLTNSRSPLLLLIAAITTSIAFSGLKNFVYQGVSVLLIVFIGLSVSDLFYEKMISVINILSPNAGPDMYGSTIDMRLGQLLVSYKYFLMSPVFGNGLDAIRNIVSNGMEEELYDSESILFLLMVNQGVIGTLLYSLFFLALYKLVEKAIFDKTTKGILKGFFVGYIVFIISTGVMDTLHYFVFLSFFVFFYTKSIQENEKNLLNLNVV